MKLLVIGCSFRSTPLDLRERMAFDDTRMPRALEELNTRYDCEAVILSTCNRVELYAARPNASDGPDAELLIEFLSEFHGIPKDRLHPHLYSYADGEAVRHLFRVVASLDSMIVGEGQIAGQVKRAYESALNAGTAGPLLNALLSARRSGRRARS
jgi:glutamyl-tRNA reductase